MPLDPMIANPSKLDLGNPLEDYNNYLLAATRKGAMRKAKREEESLNALNAAFAMPGAINPDGSMNAGVVMNALASKGVGAEIPDQWKKHLEHGEIVAKTGLLSEQTNTQKAEQALKGSQVKETEAKTATEQGKAFEQAWNNHRQLLSGINTANPAEGFKQYGDWLKAAFNNDTLRQGLESRGMTPDLMIEQLQSHMKSHTLNDLIARTTMGMDKATERTNIQTNRGTSVVNESVPTHALGSVKPEVVSQHVRVPDPKGSTVVNVAVSAGQKGLNKYEEGSAEELVKEDSALRTAARTAGPAIERIQMMQELLANGRPITGAGAAVAEQVLALAHAAGMKVDEKMLADTQLLSTQIANDSLGRIATLKGQGVSLTPMSDSDRRFLIEAGAMRTHTAQTMRRILNIEEKLHRDAIKTYERRLAGIKQNPYTRPGAEMIGLSDIPKAPPAVIRGTNGRPVPQAVIDRFLQNKNNPAYVAEIERKYGPGTAQLILGGN